MKNILMRIYSIKKLTPADRNEFIRLINGTVDTKSYIKKFCKSIGVYDHRWNHKSGYIPEFGTLYNQYFFNIQNEIFTIVAPYTTYKDIAWYDNKTLCNSYSTLELLIKFQSYLYSLLRNSIYIEISFSGEEIPRKYYLAAHFLYTINGYYDTEIALSHPLYKKERKWLEDIINKHIENKSHISCHFCETCYEHDPKYPFHTEIHTEKFDKYWEQENIQYGYYNQSIYIPQLKKEKKMMDKLQHTKYKKIRK